MYPPLYQEEILFQKPHSKCPLPPIGQNQVLFLLLKQSVAKAPAAPRMVCSGERPPADQDPNKSGFTKLRGV